MFYYLSFWLAATSVAQRNTILNNAYISKLLIVIMFAALFLIVGFRDLSFIDTAVYVNAFNQLEGQSLGAAFRISEHEPLYLLVEWGIANIFGSPRFYLIVVFFIFFFCFFRAITKLFDNWWQYSIILFSYMNFTFFYGYTMNTIREGIAISLVMLSIAYWTENKKKKAILSGILGAFFHYSALVICLLLFLGFSKKVSLKLCMALWALCSLLFITGKNKVLGTLLEAAGYQNYYSLQAIQRYGTSGNRLDFLLFSAIWIIFGLLIFKFYLRNDERYEYILKEYILFNLFFLLFGFISFSDRLASYSWFLIPILVWYPLFRSSGHKGVLAPVTIIVFTLIGIFTGATVY